MSRELKSVVIESGEMAESLFERVNEGYRYGREGAMGGSKLQALINFSNFATLSRPLGTPLDYSVSLQGPDKGDQGSVQRGAGAARHRRLRHGHQAQGRVRRPADHLQGRQTADIL